MQTSDWPFRDDPRNRAVIADQNVKLEGAWIASVFHDLDDGGWQFLTAEAKTLKSSEALVLSLQNIVDLDPTVLQLAQLPIGWKAWRTSKDAPWQMAKI